MTISELDVANDTSAAQAAQVIEKYPFRFGDQETYTPQELDDFLKRSVITLYQEVLQKKKSFYEEFAGDALTFYATLIDPLNPVNWGLSLLAADVVLHFRERFIQKNEELKNLLNIWVENRQYLNAEEVPNSHAFEETERKLHAFGINLQGIRDFDVSEFPEDKFLELHSIYNSTIYQRTKEQLNRPVKDQIRETPKALRESITLSFNSVCGFVYGVVRNFKNPRDLRTPKAMINGIKSCFSIAALTAKNIREGFDPYHKRIRRLKEEYQKIDVVLKHWEDTIQLDESINKNLRVARPMSRRVFNANAFFLGNIGTIIALGIMQAMDHDISTWAYLPYVYGSIMAVGPVKDIGESLADIYNNLNSDLARAAHETMKVFEDRRVIEAHDNVDEGFKALKLNHNGNLHHNSMA